MTFVLFGQITVLGEVMAGRPPGAEQPLVDPAGRLVMRPGDGEQPDPTDLLSVAAGELEHPDDQGRVVFNSVGLQTVITRTASRLGLLAHSEAAGQWAGEILFPWITDLLVRPRAGRRDPGDIRILFLDPNLPASQAGRQYVDLVTTRHLAAADLAWELVQRIVAHRHTLLPASASDQHRQLAAVVTAGRRPATEPAWYGLPYAAVERPGAQEPEPSGSADHTMRIAASQIRSAPTVAGPSAWSPPGPAVPEVGPIPVGAPGEMITAVPGVGRAAEAGAHPTARRRDMGGTFRVELDSGEIVTVDSPTLFGRDPAPMDGEQAVLQAVPDMTFSFSKTHLLLTPSAAGIVVTDRHSTNGVLVEHGGQLSACPPGVPTPLTLPATLRLGGRRMLVTRA
ncbi:hypothetical protein SAMN04515671_2699 [Nakamurella panacisegetis]|uniref:FHA domain-containing protein n=1 Tax=Nakamurella panacisegetis TaxID=1090615 RepID=A0A1H0PBZ5_9ACTN|nr:hypothetical protein [Nakamurella panacisegetis]SDP02225.1 hypothetical protein SAMN04515671_2699 [Nakamurella panacisegetis]